MIPKARYYPAANYVTLSLNDLGRDEARRLFEMLADGLRTQANLMKNIDKNIHHAAQIAAIARELVRALANPERPKGATT